MDSRELFAQDWTWVAGILDAAGSLAIHRRVKKGVYLDAVSYEPDVTIYGKHDLLVAIQTKFSGRFDASSLIWNKAQEIRTLLEGCQPYLIAKLPHCRLLLEFLDVKREIPRGYHPTESQRMRQESYYAHMRVLNNLPLPDEVKLDDDSLPE